MSRIDRISQRLLARLLMAGALAALFPAARAEAAAPAVALPDQLSAAARDAARAQ